MDDSQIKLKKMLSNDIESTVTSDKIIVSDDMNSVHTLANVLIKLDNDCESLRTVDSNDGVPMGLSIPFGVDLTAKTFESLINIAEKLADEFYAPNDKEEHKEKKPVPSEEPTKSTAQKDKTSKVTTKQKDSSSTTSASSKKDNKTDRTTTTKKDQTTDKTDTKKKMINQRIINQMLKIKIKTKVKRKSKIKKKMKKKKI